jgi:dihydroxyacetone kinase
MELGMGIHGESGAQRLKLLPSRQATDLAFGQLFRGSRALDIKRDDSVLLLVNNLGLFLDYPLMFQLAFLLIFRWLFES